MKKPKYFWGEATGVNADIERHNKKEQKLIEQYQQADNERFKRVYLERLYRLILSKIEVVQKIGKKKK